MAQIDTSRDALPDFNKLWDWGNVAETEKRFRAIVPRAELSHDAEYLAQLLTQIARTEGLQGHFDAAHKTLDTVETMLNANGLKLARVRYLLERGRAFNSGGKPERAMPLFQEAYKLGVEQQQMKYAIDAVHMVAIAEPDPKKQVEWNLKGIALAEADEQSKGWLEPLLNNIGECYLTLKEYDKAQKCFHRMAELQKARTGEPDMYTIKDEAKALRLGGHPERSHALMQPIFDTLVAKNQDDGYIREELAEALLALGRTDEAKPHFKKAYDFLSKDDWYSKTQVEPLKRLKKMAE